MLLPGACERAAVRGRVDAGGEPADDREARRRQRDRERLGVGAALRRRVAAADDGEGRPAEELAPAEAVEHRRRVADLEQRSRIVGVVPGDEVAVRLREPGERGREALGRRAGVERGGDCGRGNAPPALRRGRGEDRRGTAECAQQSDQRPRRRGPIACSAAQASTRASTIIARAAGRSASRRFAVDACRPASGIARRSRRPGSGPSC